ncbi:MAG: hypothetical protein ACXV2C_00020 [Candidatus Bathyarchaeia archaeon]
MLNTIAHNSLETNQYAITAEVEVDFLSIYQYHIPGYQCFGNPPPSQGCAVELQLILGTQTTLETTTPPLDTKEIVYVSVLSALTLWQLFYLFQKWRHSNSITSVTVSLNEATALINDDMNNPEHFESQ